MKGVMDWTKKHWLIVVFCLVIVGVPPALIVVSRNMSAAQRKKHTEAVTKEEQAFRKHVENYQVPGLAPGESLVEFQATINEKRSEHFKAIGDALVHEVGQVIAAAGDFNKSGHELLVERLFPTPAERGPVLPRALARRYLMPDRAHAELLRSIGAGTPPSPGVVVATLRQERDKQVSDLQTRTGRATLSEDEEKEIRSSLAKNRVYLYQKRSGDLTVYASPFVFREVGTDLPNDDLLSPTWLWDRQERFWIHQDLVRAIGKANAGAGSVEEAVVKRILRVGVDEFLGGFGGEPDPFGGMGPDASAGGAAPGSPATNYNASLTGRTGPNSVYDLRTASLSVVVDSARLPVLLDAISTTNFMTVVDCDLRRFDPAQHLAEGYFYGAGQHLVIAELRIETIWLREWTAELMPPEVRRARGVADAPQANAGGQQ